MNTSDMLVIELNGTPRERGLTYGEEAKSLIQRVVENWRADLGTFGVNSTTAKSLNADNYIRNFLAETDYVSSIKQWAPHLWEEMEGIADASGQSFDNILGLNLMDEEWIYGARIRLESPPQNVQPLLYPNKPKV